MRVVVRGGKRGVLVGELGSGDDLTVGLEFLR
jgi:hypothetical protein